MARSERLVVLLTPDEKREVLRRARALSMDVNEYVRTAITGDVDDAKLEELLERTKDAAEQSIAAIDETVTFVNASNGRIADMEGPGSDRQSMLGQLLDELSERYGPVPANLIDKYEKLLK